MRLPTRIFMVEQRPIAKQRLSKRLLALSSLALLCSSCSIVSVDYLSSKQSIDEHRGNIVTRSRLSNQTLSSLTSAGMSEQECLSDIDECIGNLQDLVITRHRRSLAMYAELHLAKAIEINNREFCQDTIDRPPIDPNFANAPKSAQEEAEFKELRLRCAQEYRAQLLNAIKNSYAYLFYEKLDKEADEVAYNKPIAGDLPTDTSIQMKDIYNVASDTLIKYLYNNRSKKYFVESVTPLIEMGLISGETSNTVSSFLNNSVSNNDGVPKEDPDLIKLLNYTFKPLEDKNKTAEEQTVTKPVSIDLYLPNEPIYLQNTKEYNQGFDEIFSSSELNFKGLNTVSSRDGVGVSYVALFNDRFQASIRGLLQNRIAALNSDNPNARIHMTGNLLLTGVVIPKSDSVLGVLDTNEFDIKLYNPYHTLNINILDEPYQLAANFSASYGMWLAENRLDNVGYFSLLSEQQTLQQPQLFMLEPYDPNKRVIIMLHGLASSPAAWVSVTNDISNDPVLRSNYQVWQIFYPTNIPIIENRFRIQELINTTYKKYDPTANNPASQHSVIVGHSMGALIARMLVSNENLEARLLNTDKIQQDQELNKLINDQLNEQSLINRLHLQKLNSVDTAVFISAPFRGTDFADRWFTRALRRIVRLPLGFAQALTTNLTSIATQGELVANPLGALFLQNGASQLSAKSSFIQLTADLKIANDVTYHSIIAHRDSDIYEGLKRLKIIDDPSIPQVENIATDATSIPSLGIQKAKETEEGAQSVTGHISDGIVPYESAHLEGASSETVISGGHDVQHTPEAVLVLRRVLHQHLEKYPTSKLTSTED